MNMDTYKIASDGGFFYLYMDKSTVCKLQHPGSCD